MLLSILKIVLAPVLMVQGRQVKKNTPRLPEAKGPRKGIRGDGGKQIRLLILGDSAAAGVGVDHQDHALAGQILACFGPDYRVEWTLKAKTGVTTKKTLEYLEALAPLGKRDFRQNHPTPVRMIDKPFGTVIPFVPLVQDALVDWGSR